jgi:hypothetical protein
LYCIISIVFHNVLKILGDELCLLRDFSELESFSILSTTHLMKLLSSKSTIQSSISSSIRLEFKSIAMTISAHNFLHKETGIGFTIPQSINHFHL